MAIEHIQASQAPAATDVDLLAVALHEEGWLEDETLRSLDEALGGRLVALLEEEGFEAKSGKQRLVDTLGSAAPRRILVYGMGKRKSLGLRGVRDYVHAAFRSGHGARAKTVGVVLDPAWERFQACLAAELSGYDFNRHKSEGKKPFGVENAVWWSGGGGDLGADTAKATAVGGGISRVRDLVNEPPAVCTPSHLVAQAHEIAERHGMEINVLGRAELEARGFGCILGVSAGSEEEPYLIHLIWRPKAEARGRVALVGKGITFDSGGYDLKPPQHMLDMKCDMAGAATVLGTLDAIGGLAPPVEVHGIVPTCENLVNGKAFKPGDILTSYTGKTIEIGNTDAEGRLILADALGYAQEQEPDLIIDMATLTGACVVALGDYTSGLFSDHDDEASALLAAAEAVDESFWRMPLDKKLRKQIESRVADLKNVGKRYGGAITAGLFLKEFVGERPWIHLDIAGPAFLEGGLGAIPKGGSGFGVLTLARFIEDFGA